MFPPNCRVFIGNLPGDKTSPEELMGIFEKFGRLGEEPVIRRSFGFIQFLDERCARAAIEHANGTVVGGLRIELSLADNRPAKGRDLFDDSRGRGAGKRDRDARSPRGRRGPSPRRSEGRKRGASPDRPDRFRDDDPSWKRSSDRRRPDADRRIELDDESDFVARSRMSRVVSVRPLDPLSDVLIIRVDQPSRGYCLAIEEKITDSRLLFEDREVDLEDLPETLVQVSERFSVRNVFVIGRRHESLENLTFGARRPSGRIEEFREMPIRDVFREIAAAASLPVAAPPKSTSSTNLGVGSLSDPPADAIVKGLSRPVDSYPGLGKAQEFRPQLPNFPDHPGPFHPGLHHSLSADQSRRPIDNPPPVQNSRQDFPLQQDAAHGSAALGSFPAQRVNQPPAFPHMESSAPAASSPWELRPLPQLPPEASLSRPDNDLKQSSGPPSAAAKPPEGFDASLVGFLEQLKSLGGPASLSDHSTKDALLKVLQSRPDVVNFLISRVQPELAASTGNLRGGEINARLPAGQSTNVNPLPAPPLAFQQLQQDSQSQRPVAASQQYASNLPQSIVLLQQQLNPTPNNPLSVASFQHMDPHFSGAVPQIPSGPPGGLSIRQLEDVIPMRSAPNFPPPQPNQAPAQQGPTNSDPASSLSGIPAALTGGAGFGNLDMNSLQDLLAATAPLLGVAGESSPRRLISSMNRSTELSNFAQVTNSPLSTTIQYDKISRRPQHSDLSSVSQNFPGAPAQQQQTLHPSTGHAAAPPASGIDVGNKAVPEEPSSVDLLNLLARPLLSTGSHVTAPPQSQSDARAPPPSHIQFAGGDNRYDRGPSHVSGPFPGGPPPGQPLDNRSLPPQPSLDPRSMPPQTASMDPRSMPTQAPPADSRSSVGGPPPGAFHFAGPTGAGASGAPSSSFPLLPPGARRFGR